MEKMLLAWIRVTRFTEVMGVPFFSLLSLVLILTSVLVAFV